MPPPVYSASGRCASFLWQTRSLFAKARSTDFMSLSNPRYQAIQMIATHKHKLDRVDFRKTHIKDLFGVNVFNEQVQRQRLPKPVYNALQKTIKQGVPL